MCWASFLVKRGFLGELLEIAGFLCIIWIFGTKESDFLAGGRGR